MTTPQLNWKFPRVFWAANIIELFERAAYYGTFIVLAVYLTQEVGFTDIETGWVTAFFAASIYLVPSITGTLSDRIGFRNSLALAFALLSVGYFLLGLLPVKFVAIVSLMLIMIGGSFVKPVISGTVAKSSDDAHRARAFSLFYMMVNIGSFSGKTIARPLRVELGIQYINFYSAAMSLIALILVLLYYKGIDEKPAVVKTIGETFRGLLTVLRNGRFMALILIVAGFWAIQQQLYATMPKYALRLIGPHASPEWLSNINPLIVVALTLPVTHFMRRVKPVNSIGVALFIIPLSALTISGSALLRSVAGEAVEFGPVSLHPVTVTLLAGIALQGLAECFLSPRFLEFASRQAPPGQEGLYMGYSYLTTFFANLFGFVSSGYLLDRYCPDPRTLSPEQIPAAYQHAHYIWYFFTFVGVFAFFLLLLFKYITNRIDNRVKSH
jgi:dipeptide/tripeptide permease